MRLSPVEFQAMNHPVRRLLQRRIELPVFRRLGMDPRGRDVLEVGCGSGYGAALLAALGPRSYEGFDVMPEQVALAEARGLPGCRFRVLDATDLSDVPEASKDLVVIFGILHHVPEWRRALDECLCVLRPGGRIYYEEPDGAVLRQFDRVFHWGHQALYPFSLAGCAAHLRGRGCAEVGHLALGPVWAWWGWEKRE